MFKLKAENGINNITGKRQGNTAFAFSPIYSHYKIKFVAKKIVIIEVNIQHRLKKMLFVKIPILCR